MRDFAQAQIAEIAQVDEGEEEYYDEEDDAPAVANDEAAGAENGEEYDEEDDAPAVAE